MKSAVRWIRRHKIGVALACLFLAGLFLRIWGLSSVYQRVDDLPVAKQIYHAYLGDWKPDPAFFYPVFFGYIVGLLLRLVSGALAFLGVHQTPGLYEFTADQVLLIARFASAAMGSLTILLVFKIGKRLFSETTALVATFFLSFSFVHILHSHQIVLDVPMAFFYALSLFFCVLILKDGRWPHYLAASLFAGLATATKYNGIFIVLSILMAHIWKKSETQKNILKIFLDKKIWVSGFVTILGFFAGHPYALLWFQTFLRSTRELAMWVHAPEWYTVLIKPRTLLGKLAESKYVKGLWNVLSAEGLVVFLLIVLGVVWVLRRRKKEEAFLSVSGLIYFLGALGYIGFSRFRDLSTLALFTSFFAAFGLLWLRDILKRSRPTRAVFAALAALLLMAVAVRSLGEGYYLHEDDTTQIAERWIKRNIPPGSSIGREWFTADITDPAYEFRIRTQPYLIQDFPPFDQIDVIESSSASGGFFLKYRTYYPDQVAVYDDLDHKHELLKDFYFKAIEYKNPEVKIYSGKFEKQPKPLLDLPSMPADPTPLREFEINDGSPYGTDINGFFLSAGEGMERIFISRTKIARLAVFVRSPEGAGEITVRNGRRSHRIEVETGRDTALLISPSRTFPYHRYMYKVRLQASDSMGPCFVKICSEPLAIALEFFRGQDYAQAGEFFRQALEAAPPGAGLAEIHLYLAYCAKKMGRPDEERGFMEKFAGSPQAGRLSSVVRALARDETWKASFEEYAGIPLSLFSSIQTVRIDDDRFTFENGTVLPSDPSSNHRARAVSPGTGGPMTALSPAKRLPPQSYAAEFRFFNPNGFTGEIGEAEILFQKGESEERRVIPLRLDSRGGDPMSAAAVSFKKEDHSSIIRFKVRLFKGPLIAFDGLTVKPDVRAFLSDRYALFRDYLK